MQYLFEQMIFRASDFQQNQGNIRSTQQNFSSASGKNLPPTALNKSSETIKIPSIDKDGIFWNISHHFATKNTIRDSSSLDQIFEEQMLREHLFVVKVAIFTYISNFSEKENSFHKEGELNSQFWSDELPVHKNSTETINNFIQQLRDSREFKDAQIKNLKIILIHNPQFWRMLQRFSQVAFNFLKTQISFIIFKGLQLYLNLCNDGFSNYDNLLEYIEQNYDQICHFTQNCHTYKETMPEQSDENYRKMSKQIILSVVLSAKGQSFNPLYEESLKKKPQDVCIRGRQLGSVRNFSTQLKSLKVKKTINLRRSISDKHLELQLPKKRHQSYDQ